jgi:hypothetical protein
MKIALLIAGPWSFIDLAPDVAGEPVRKEEAEPHLKPATFSANNDLQN